MPVQRPTSSSIYLIATATSAVTRPAADKGERSIAALVVLLGSLFCASSIVAVEEVDIKEGEEDKKEKRTLLT